MTGISSIAMVGSGAIGSYYGARLGLAGADVRFIVRRDVNILRQRGITLRERDATRHFERVAAFERPEEIGAVDLVIVSLKTTANAALPGLLPPLIGPATAVLTLQNGLGNEEYVANLVGRERVFGGLCFIAVNRESPGELVGYHTPGWITLGELDRPIGPQARAIAGWFERAGIAIRLADNLGEARWRKLIWNIPFNGLAIAGGGITTDRILADPELAREVRALMDEVAVAGRHFGYDVPDVFIEGQIAVTPPMGAYKPSSLVDYLAGREVEVEAIWGEPLRRAQAAGVPMPRLEQLYIKLKRLTKTG